jgi:hypothetical protein
MSDHHPTSGSNGFVRRPASDLEDLLLSTDIVASLLQDLVGAAVATFRGQFSAGITLDRGGRPATVASSDARTAQYDEVQYALNQGPCLIAMHAQTIVLVDDLAGDERFEEFRPRALALGVRSSLSLPLTGQGAAVGALNLYSGRAHAFGAVEQEEAQRFADEASRAVKLAMRLVRSVQISGELQAELASRTALDQAIGVIMGQYRCDARTALGVLRAASRSRNLDLDLIAAQVVASAGWAEPIPPD